MAKAEQDRWREYLSATAIALELMPLRSLSGKTLQHLPTLSTSAPVLASSTSRPSHSSATKFLTNRLYSKKRAISVMDAGTANHAQPSERKKKKGMSDESKFLLGLGPDPALSKGGPTKSDRDRSKLLQAEGMRKSRALALSLSPHC